MEHQFVRASVYFTACLFVLLSWKVILATDPGATFNDVLAVFPSISLLELGSWLWFAGCFALYPDTYARWRLCQGGSRETRMVDDGQGGYRQNVLESQWESPDYENARYKFRLLQAAMIISGIAVIGFTFKTALV